MRGKSGSFAARGVGVPPALLVALGVAVSVWTLQGCEQEKEHREGMGSSGAPVALVVYDAGETLALLPVADRLRESGVQVEWYPLTPWAADLLSSNQEPFYPLPAGIADMPHIRDREGVAETDYWEMGLARGPPGLVVSGLVSQVQGALGARLREVGIPTRGIYDGFQPPNASSIGFRMASNFHEIWVPTERVREGFAQLGLETVVVGQPTLETWRRGSEEVDVAEVRRTQGLDPRDRVLLFAGQYGEGYREVLDLFLRSVTKTLESDTSLVLVVSHHPRTDGSVEREALERAGLGERAPEGGGAARAAMMTEELNTMEMATASEVILTWTSTVATQAAFMGKRVIYFSPPAGFDTYMADVGAALVAKEGFLPGVLAQALASPESPEEIRRALLEAGYVVDADVRVAESVREALKFSHDSATPSPISSR